MEDYNTVLAKAPPPEPRPKPHRCDLTGMYMNDNFKPKTMDYNMIAHKYEKYNNNNSVLMGKNLSDNKPVTNFYQAKGHGATYIHHKRPIADAIARDEKQHLPDPSKPNGEGKLYSQKMLD